jgi:leukotriene-A4 hydrolase
LAGDRSLANVVAHEISHSWSGNLVTNSTWEHFWLNEVTFQFFFNKISSKGFTVYIERRILAKMYSEEYAAFHAILGLKKLEKDIQNFKEKNKLEYTKLIPEFLIDF